VRESKKYQPFKEKHLISLLNNKILKFSNPGSFNDPWDCKANYIIPKSIDEKNEVLDFFKKAHAKNKSYYSDSYRLKLVNNMLNNNQIFENAINQMSNEVNFAIDEQYRVFCLTEHPDSILMWSHYASSHSGICIEFNTDFYPFRLSDGIQKIKYVMQYPQYKILDERHEPLIVKSNHWKYESEWRLIAEEKSKAKSEKTIKTENGLFIFDTKSIKSIILGSMMKIEDQKCVQDIIQEFTPHVIIKRQIFRKHVMR
jgi:hypothetical protein